jgi:hypothetical protein
MASDNKISIRITSGSLAGKTGRINKEEFDPNTMELGGLSGTMNRALPYLGATVGGLGGLLLGPAGAVAGTAGGYAGGKTLQRSQSDILTGGASRPSRQISADLSRQGVNNPSAGQAFNQAVLGDLDGSGESGPLGKDLTSTATAGLAGLGGYGLLSLLNNLKAYSSGPNYVGKLREELIDDEGYTLPRKELEKASSKVDKTQLTTQNQKEFEATKNIISDELYPLNEVAKKKYDAYPPGLVNFGDSLKQPDETSLNRAYGLLRQIQNSGEKGTQVKYGQSGGEGAKAAYGALRSTANELYPAVEALNKLYSKTKGFENISNSAKGSILKFLLYRAMSGINPFSGGGR